MISYLTFGMDEENAKKVVLKNIRVKGRKNDNTQLALIALFYEGNDAKFEIPQVFQDNKLQIDY